MNARLDMSNFNLKQLINPRNKHSTAISLKKS